MALSGKVLIADDDQNVLELIKLYGEREGYIRDVAHEMGSHYEDENNTDFHGVGKCDQEAYKAAVAAFLADQGADVEVPETEGENEDNNER